MNVGTRPLAESARLAGRARELIPMGAQTLSKSASQWVGGIAPSYISRARGAHVWDVDGNRYLDMPMALGPVILGHAHPAVNEAITTQLEEGIVFTLSHPLELEVAEAIVQRVPCAERVRFGKSGSDATSAAIRLARAYTGREHVVAGGYHGWHDWYIGSTSRAAGVPGAVRDLVGTFDYNDLGSLEAALAAQDGDTAAVILEPAGSAEPEPGFLEGVAERTRAAGALLVFDEIITGFRLAPGGAQERYGVTPDLATFGKALGNGMPISALAGRAEVMERLEEVFFSGTHGGEALSLAAARAVLAKLDRAAYEQLHAGAERLRAGIAAGVAAAGVEEWVSVAGASPYVFVAVREPDPESERLVAKAVVQQELLKRGVLFNGSNFVSLAHTDPDLDQAAESYAAAFARLAEGLEGRLEDVLEGEPLAPAFRPTA